MKILKISLWICALTVFLLQTMAALANEQEKSTNKTLPVFGKGKWKDKHAVYEQQNFVAYMDKSGVLWIQLMEKDKKIGKPLTCYQLSCYYNSPMHRIRPVQTFSEFPDPQKQPKEIHLKGMLEENVPFEVKYEFDRNEITASGGCKDPKGIKHKTNFRILCRIPRSHEIPPQMELEERKELLEDFALKTTERVNGRRKRFEYPYHEILKFHGHLEEAKIEDVYAPRKVTFEPDKIEGTFSGWVYSGRCPWEGFIVQYITDPDDIDLRKNQVQMTID